MSYALYIGGNHTADGNAYLAGYGDEPSSHWLELHPEQTHARDAMITVGVTENADLPGNLKEIPQAERTARNIRVEYSYYKGVPAPLTNGGLNEHGVAVRDVWSPSRAELIAMTKPDQTGPNYSDLARMVVEQATTARAGVELIGALIKEHGYSTYGGNSHLIADATEAWVVIEFAGSKGLWVAERLDANSIRASRPGYIGKVDIHDTKGDRFLFSENFVSFAEQQGWHDPDKNTGFDANQVYGDGKQRWPGVAWIEDEMMARAKRRGKLQFEDIAWAIRTEKLTGDTAGYGQIVKLETPEFPELHYLWHTQTGAISAPFTPVFLGAKSAPEEYRKHRYLTTGEDARFEDTRHAISDGPHTVSQVPQGIESTRSAFYVFKRLQYLMMQDPASLPEITRLWEAREAGLRELTETFIETAHTLLKNGQRDRACEILTYFTHTELTKSLELAETLAAALEAKARLLRGIDPNPEPKKFDQIW